MFGENWVSKTNQTWKVVLFVILLLLSFLGFLVLIWLINSSSQRFFNIWILDEVTLSLSFVGLGLVAFVLLGFSIRCPVCRKNIGGLILTTSSANDWFKDLVSLQKCPHCGDINECMNEGSKISQAKTNVK